MVCPHQRLKPLEVVAEAWKPACLGHDSGSNEKFLSPTRVILCGMEGVKQVIVVWYGWRKLRFAVINITTCGLALSGRNRLLHKKVKVNPFLWDSSSAKLLIVQLSPFL